MSPPRLPSPAALHRAITERIAIDARALATFRVALGVIVLVDLALRSRSLVAFYTDAGVVDRAVLADAYPLYSSLSIHTLSGDLWWQVVLFALAGCLAMAMIVGYRTRLATVASLVLLVSLHARNPTLVNSGDVLLRRLLFWGVLLPLGSRLSLDAARSTADQSRDHWRQVANLASFGLLLQVVLVYAMNAQSKLGSEQWFAGDAVETVLSLEQFATGLAPVLLEVPAILAVLTALWLVLLFSSWLLLVTTGRVRGVLAAAFFGVHLGMLLTMDLAIFPLVSMAGLLPFLPTRVWDRVELFFNRRSIPRPDVRTLLGNETSRGDRTETSNEATGVAIGGAWLRRYAGPSIRATCVVLLVLSNAVAVGLVPAPEGTPEQLTDSSWVMFARPPTTEVWTVADGRLESGQRIDALRELTPGLDRPPDVGGYPAARWRKHLSRYRDNPALTPALAEYLCRQWTGADRGRLETVSIERVSRHGDDRDHRTLGRYRCTGTGVEPIDGDER